MLLIVLNHDNGHSSRITSAIREAHRRIVIGLIRETAVVASTAAGN